MRTSTQHDRTDAQPPEPKERQFHRQPEMFEIDVAKILHHTQAAVLVRTDVGTEHWIALSQILEVHQDSIIVPQWFATKAGIDRDISQAYALRGRRRAEDALRGAP